MIGLYLAMRGRKGEQAKEYAGGTVFILYCLCYGGGRDSSPARHWT